MDQFDGQSRAKDAELLPLRRKRGTAVIIGDDREHDRGGTLPRKRKKIDVTGNSRQRETIANDNGATRTIGHFQNATKMSNKITLGDNVSGMKIPGYACTSRDSGDHSMIRANTSKRTDDDHIANTTKSDQRLSLVEEIARDKKCSKDGLAMAEDNETTPAKLAKSSTPELLCEEVGTNSPFRVTIPREAIKLNLNAYRSLHQRHRNDVHRPASTEISIADSSVTDNDADDADESKGSTTTRRESGSAAASVTSAKSDSRMKPKIIEDVTCVEGTIFARASLINSSNLATGSTSVTRLDDSTPEGPERNSVHRRSTNFPRTKKRPLAVTFSGKKLRLRRTFRQIFGNDLTLSELEEEDDIVERFVRKRRKKKARSSLDSGVSLTDSITNDILVEHRDGSPDLNEHRDGSLDLNEHRNGSPELNEHRDGSPDLNQHRDGSPDLNEHRDGSPDLNEHRDGSLDLNEHRDGSPQLNEHRDGSPDLNQHRDGSLDLNEHRDGSPDLNEHRDGRPDLNEHRDGSPDLTTHRESLDEKRDVVSTPETSSIKEETRGISKPPSALSMPPLDRSPSRVSSSRESPLPEVHSLPDSSTSSLGGEVLCVKTETTNAWFEDKTPKANGKVTILVSPVNPESPDAFTPVSLEIEVPCNGNNQRATTPLTSLESTTRRRCSETITVDYSRTGSSSGDSTGVTVTIARDEPDQSKDARISIDEETPSEIAVPINGKSRVLEESVNSIEKESTGDEAGSTPVAINNQEFNDAEVTIPPLVSFPKLRVRRPSELGSRWCPTPLNVPPPFLGDSLASQSLPVTTGPFPSRDDHSSVNGNIQRATSVPDNPLLPSQSVGSRQSFNYDSTSTINLMNYPAQQTNYATPIPTRIIVPNNSSMVYTIALLMSLQSYIQRYKSLYVRYDTTMLQREYHTKKQQLWQLLSRLGTEIGACDIRHIVEYVMRHYEAAIPPGRRAFTREKIFNILSIDRLEPLTMQLPSERAATRYIPIPPTAQFSPQPSPPYPASPVFEYPTPVCPPRQACPVLNPGTADRRASDPSARRPSSQSTSTIFTPHQLTILRNQIVAYQYLLRKSPPMISAPAPVPRQRKARKASVAALPKDNTIARSSIIVRANDHPSVPTPLEGNPALRDESRSISNPSVIRQPENAASRVILSTGVSSADYLAPKPQSNTSVKVTDVLQTLARLSSSTSPHDRDNAKDDDNSNEDKNRETRCDRLSYPTGETPTPEAIVNTTEMSPGDAETTIDETSPNDAVTAIDETSPDNAITAIDETSPNNGETVIDKTTADDASATSSESQSSVMIIDEDADVVFEGSSDDIGPNFSILDVKTITKDVFNNMGESTAPALATSESLGQTTKDSDIRTVDPDSTGCLRCGEPCCVVCEQCYEAFYCSSECHEAHWTEHHYLTCRPVPAEALARLQSGVSSPNDTLYSYDGLDIEQTSV